VSYGQNNVCNLFRVIWRASPPTAATCVLSFFPFFLLGNAQKKTQTMQTQQLSRVMHASWRIQRKKHVDRSGALTQAWQMFQNADLLLQFLYTKHSKQNSRNKKQSPNLSIF
jgi:hypothetical protein